MTGEAKNYFVPLTGEESVDAYDAWVILATKLDDLPEASGRLISSRRLPRKLGKLSLRYPHVI